MYLYDARRVGQSSGSAGAPLGAFHEPVVAPHALVAEDVAIEMLGRQFRLSAPVNAVTGAVLPAGTVVTPLGWVNDQPLVPVRNAAGVMASAPKTALRPVAPSTPGVAPYSAGVDAQAAAATRRETAVADWKSAGARARTTGTPRFNAELARREDLLVRSRRALNRFLIQETMYNRFDPDIAQWVDFYNRQFRMSGARALDPNIVKAMIFQESRMGTSGRHLEVPPSHMVKTRFNLMQVIDSSASALLVMIQEMQPALVASRHLANLQRDLASAKRELAQLRALATRTPPQESRRLALVALSKQSWEVFIWRYREAGQASGFLEAVNDFFAGVPRGQPPRNEDYAFWIRAGVRWLFEKRGAASDWPGAVRAYNGSGPAADRYRDAVVGRARDAAAALAARQPFQPPN
jgi:hypothetical protein